MKTPDYPLTRSNGILGRYTGRRYSGLGRRIGLHRHLRSGIPNGHRLTASFFTMNRAPESLEHILRSSKRGLVIGVGGGGDVVGALAVARMLEFCGIEFILGGLSWERYVFDPLPGPRSLDEVENVRELHRYVWMANAETRTKTGVYFAESRMAEIRATEVLLVDINGGVSGV